MPWIKSIYHAKAFYSQFYQIFALLSKLQFQAASGLIFVSHNIYNKLTIRSSYIHNGNLPNIKENLAIRSNWMSAWFRFDREHRTKLWHKSRNFKSSNTKFRIQDSSSFHGKPGNYETYFMNITFNLFVLI